MTMPAPNLTTSETELLEKIRAHFVSQQGRFGTCVKNLHNVLTDNPNLREILHSTKYRVKDPDHLLHKLHRKLAQCKSESKPFDITPENLFTRIDDLAGIRLIHLHTDQFAVIRPLIQSTLEEGMYGIIEGPIANTWDEEYKRYFESFGVQTQMRGSMYTSVHYIIEENSKLKLRCELQVRTLSEELWGEVSHSVDYPDATPSVACQEQMKVLARLTSGSTRLVDSIFKSKREYSDFRSALGSTSAAAPTKVVHKEDGAGVSSTAGAELRGAHEQKEITR